VTNFEFLLAEWPEVFESATKAEALANPDARAACFYARRALELAVSWLYKHDSKGAPTANQIEFINLMINHLTQRGLMEPTLLYESPFTDISPRGVEGVFESNEIMQLLSVLTSIREHAAV
jgi:hypothetical protein